MADFVQTGVTKTSVRELGSPIANIAAFDAIIGQVLADNPFECVDYEENGVLVPGVVRGRESYTVRVNYEDDAGRRVGTITARAPNVAGFNACAADIMGDTDLVAAMGGDPVRDSERESYSCQLRCHDPNGEDYLVTFSRRRVRISSYEDDAIRARVETWADTVPELA
ncbi:MAG: hypothetical protein QHG99_00115 [Methanomicrobiales archaeon]|nr:hypothetical protein [Methanomicrobiales archaeon]